MNDPSQQVNPGKLHTGAPGWRPLTAVAALVVAVHALVLQASPPQLGMRPSTDEAGKTFVTRNIEPAPAVEAAVAAPPKAVKIAKTTRNHQSNQPLAPKKSAQAAPEIIAAVSPPPEPQPEPLPAVPAPQEPAESAVSSVPNAPTPTVAALPAGPSAVPAKPVTAIRLPGSVRLEYKVVGLSKNLTYKANAELDWATDGTSYNAMMKVSAFLIGSRSLTSVGKITDSGLAPSRFADKFRSEVAAHFLRDEGKIIFSANSPDATWVEGVQDRVSVFLQLAGMLAARPQDFPAGSSISFLTVGPRAADTWTFVVDTEETLDLMGAPMAALKLTHKPRKEFDQKVEIWFAPSLGYLPVRSRITQQSGDFIDQQLTEVVKG